MAGVVPQGFLSTSGKAIYAGQKRIRRFDSVSVFSEDAGVPYTTSNHVLVVQLHGSSGSNLTTGRQYRAAVSGKLAYEDQRTFSFSTIRTTNPLVTLLRPVDWQGSYTNSARREGMWLGYKHIRGSNDVFLMIERRLDAMFAWADENITNNIKSKTCLTGGSMGGWGTMTVGIHRYDRFAALYPDRPRWRYNNAIGSVAVADWTGILGSSTVAAAPNLHLEDGGGSVAIYHDIIAYVSNLANKVRWIGWNVGWQDGFTLRADHVAAVAAMRAAKRGFAFAWNNGNHTVGTIPTVITDSYPYGTFQIGVGYPLFTEHSLDGDPAVDDVGGINVGLSFRNVVESSTGWSCEVTHISTPCTVKVEPLSDIFTASVASKLVTISTAGTWVPVSFSA